MIVGATRRSTELAFEYAKERIAFGRPIGGFQAIQHMCANMVTWVDGAELLTREALWRIAEGLPAAKEVATAKAFCNERCQAALRWEMKSYSVLKRAGARRVHVDPIGRVRLGVERA